MGVLAELVSGLGSATQQLCRLGPNAWPLWASVACKIRLYWMI